MTQTDPNYTDDELAEIEATPWAKKLRKQVSDAERRAREAEERSTENVAAVKRVAFLDAGIPDTPASRFYREHYAGDLTSDAIKADAITNGFLATEDHTEEIGAIAGQSEGVAGGEGPAALGDQAEMLREMDEAASKAPRGKEAQAIAEVVARYQRQA